jgi:hypothetical protein
VWIGARGSGKTALMDLLAAGVGAQHAERVLISPAGIKTLKPAGCDRSRTPLGDDTSSKAELSQVVRG